MNGHQGAWQDHWQGGLRCWAKIIYHLLIQTSFFFHSRHFGNWVTKSIQLLSSKYYEPFQTSESDAFVSGSFTVHFEINFCSRPPFLLDPDFRKHFWSCLSTSFGHAPSKQIHTICMKFQLNHSQVDWHTKTLKKNLCDCFLQHWWWGPYDINQSWANSRFWTERNYLTPSGVCGACLHTDVNSGENDEAKWFTTL